MGLHGNVKVDLLDNLQVFSYSYLSGIQEAMLARHIVLLKQITEGVSEQVTQGCSQRVMKSWRRALAMA